MQPEPRHSGDMSQDSAAGALHLSPVLPASPVVPIAIDPAARTSKRLYEGLSESSAGLELGIAVGLGALFGSWLDGKLGTDPWMLLVFLLVGVIAGFRGLLRAVARADRAASRG
jgi:ATP synthase protein I